MEQEKIQNLDKILENIKPFVKRHKMREYSTVGQWFDAKNALNFVKIDGLKYYPTI